MLAGAAVLGCNASMPHLSPPPAGRPRPVASRSAITRFEERSLALFAAVAIGAWAVPTRAQPQAAETVRASRAVGTFVPASEAVPSQTVRAAFSRADTDGDGRLSRQESVRLPAVHERFTEIDTDKDQLLSPEEFYKGVSED